MCKLVLFACCLVIPLTAWADDDAKKDLAKFQGTWKAISAERDGEKLPDEEFVMMTVTFKDDTVTVKKKGEDAGKGEKQTFKIDSAKKPAQIDVTPKSLGIYQFNGDRLTIRFTRGEGERPTEFTSKTRRGEAMLTVERVK